MAGKSTMTALDQAILRGSVMGAMQSCDQCSRFMFHGRSPNPFMVVGQVHYTEARTVLAEIITEARLPAFDSMFLSGVQSCSRHLSAQVKLCDPEWVLLFGADALAATGVVKAKIGEIHGRPFEAPAGPFIGRWCFPTYHPQAGLRDERLLLKIKADMPNLSRIIAGTLPRDAVSVRVGRGGKVVA